MKYKDKLDLIKYTLIGLLYLTLNYIVFKLYIKDFISLDQVNNHNVLMRFIQDLIFGLSIPMVLIIINFRKLKTLGFTKNSLYLCMILFVIYIIFFVLHSDYSARGIYRAIYYLLIVGFTEEIIMRGFLYLRLKPINMTLAIIISGTIFGAGHAILTGILSGKEIWVICFNMINYIGGDGLLFGLIFIACMELGGNILVAILIHGLLDYSYSYYGLLVLIITLAYLYYKNKNQRKLIDRFTL